MVFDHDKLIVLRITIKLKKRNFVIKLGNEKQR